MKSIDIRCIEINSSTVSPNKVNVCVITFDNDVVLGDYNWVTLLKNDIWVSLGKAKIYEIQTTDDTCEVFIVAETMHVWSIPYSVEKQIEEQRRRYANK